MRKAKNNNQGSTLVTVIIILAFIGILGSMMLSVTMTNLQMKMIERKSKVNFYTCEIILDEIRTGLQELTIDSIKYIYEEKLLRNSSNILTTERNELNRKLKKEVSLDLVSELSDKTISELQSYSPIEVDVVAEKLLSFLTRELDGVVEFDTISIEKVIEEGKEEYKSVKLNNVYVSLTTDEFKSSIRTDIVVELPEFVLNEEVEIITYKMKQPYENYALIADGWIKSENIITDSNSEINGDVYAGKGISVGGQAGAYYELSINGNNIVTRGDIVVTDFGSLIVDENNSIPAMIWADNIRTISNGASHLKPRIHIRNGICLIKDDLTLDGKSSEVKLEGAYVGYSTASGESPSLSSAIIVNGSDSSLDLSNLDSLILAGRAYVSVTDSYNDFSKDILTGESVAIKSNQKAYLIPGEFIDGIGHNPVSIDEYNPEQTISFPSSDEDIYSEHLVLGKEYKEAFRQTVEGGNNTILCYYYLNFRDGLEADKFLLKYKSKYSLDKLSPFSMDSLKLPESGIKVVGNLTSYDYDEFGEPKVEILGGDSDENISDYQLEEYYGSALLKEVRVGQLSSLYRRMYNLLSLESNRKYNDDPVVKAIDNPSHPTSGFTIPGQFRVEYGNIDIDYPFTDLMVVYGNVNISEGANIKGMILAIGDDVNDTSKGNISVANAEVEGRLMATGNIILGAGNTFTASENGSEAYEILEEIFNNQSNVISNYLNNLEQSAQYTVPIDNLVDLSTMIYYRNWRRE